MFAVDTLVANDCNRQMGKGARSRLARKLRWLRALRGWSQEDLADVCGLHRTHISLIERAVCSVTLDNLEQLAHSFGLTLPELLDAELLNAREPADVGRRSPATSGRSGRKKKGRKPC